MGQTQNYKYIGEFYKMIFLSLNTSHTQLPTGSRKFTNNMCKSYGLHLIRAKFKAYEKPQNL